jgi:DNA processing protein
MPSIDEIREHLAAACLRPAPDTLACRVLKKRGDEGSDSSLAALAAELGIDPMDLGGRLDEARRHAGRLLEEAARLGVDLVTSIDTGPDRYPERLSEIADPPIAFWRKGPAPLDARSVAIVGSRTATPAGLIVARQLSRDLVDRGYTIVSGLAAGVDGAAHESALAAGGLTVAVLGCGIDIAYPWRHRDLARRVATSGCLMSEFPPGTAPKPGHFPLRNRIISGLAHAVVVVEASERSGSLITARLAMDQGRDVLAVPGSVASGRYRGCHALIRDGARLVETVDDIVEELEGIQARGAGEASDCKSLFISYLEPVMARGESYTVDDLAARTGRPGPELLADLGHLEIEGRITRTAGGRFVRP